MKKEVGMEFHNGKQEEATLKKRKNSHVEIALSLQCQSSLKNIYITIKPAEESPQRVFRFNDGQYFPQFTLKKNIHFQISRI